MMSSSSSRPRSLPAVLWRFSRNSFILGILAEFKKTWIKIWQYMEHISNIHQCTAYIHRHPSICLLPCVKISQPYNIHPTLYHIPYRITSISQTHKGRCFFQNPSIIWLRHDADPSQEGMPTPPSRPSPWNSKKSEDWHTVPVRRHAEGDNSHPLCAKARNFEKKKSKTSYRFKRNHASKHLQHNPWKYFLICINIISIFYIYPGSTLLVYDSKSTDFAHPPASRWQNHPFFFQGDPMSIGSMYGIFTYMWLTFLWVFM